jgi:hypothetical protein
VEVNGTSSGYNTPQALIIEQESYLAVYIHQQTGKITAGMVSA